MTFPPTALTKADPFGPIPMQLPTARSAYSAGISSETGGLLLSCRSWRMSRA